MDKGGAVYRLSVGVDVAAETFVVAWLAPGGQPGTPCDGEPAGRHAGGARSDRELLGRAGGGAA